MSHPSPECGRHHVAARAACYARGVTTTAEQLAATLVSRRRRALAEEAARALAIRQRLHEVMTRAGRAGLFRRAFLIGSLAKGRFGAGSDVDLVVEGLDERAAGRLYGELLEAAGVEVDLLRLEELSPAFCERVLTEGVLLHGS